MKDLLEAGKIVNTHGIKGEIKIQPWADSPDFLLDFEYIYIGSEPVKVLAARVHKNHIIASLEEVNDIDSAIRLKNKIISIDRNDANLPPGEYFLQDIMGFDVIDEGGTKLGSLKDVLSMPTQNILVVNGDREYLIPDVEEFVLEKNLSDGYIKVKLIEGM